MRRLTSWYRPADTGSKSFNVVGSDYLTFSHGPYFWYNDTNNVYAQTTLTGQLPACVLDANPDTQAVGIGFYPAPFIDFYPRHGERTRF
jgi:hypothetical protein